MTYEELFISVKHHYLKESKIGGNKMLSLFFKHNIVGQHKKIGGIIFGAILLVVPACVQLSWLSACCRFVCELQ